MKVLFVVSSCCTPRISPKRIYTGYDYIVSDIAEKLGSICQVEIYSLNPCPENSHIGGVAVKSCVNYKRLLKKIRFGDIVRYVNELKNDIGVLAESMNETTSKLEEGNKKVED